MTKKLTYGDGSVYQRKSDGRWFGALTAGWTENGRRRRVTVSASTEAQVRVRLKQRRAEIERAKGQVSSGAMLRQTLKGWADEWLPIREQAVRPKTYDVDRAAIRRWAIPTMGAKRLVDLTPRDVRNFHARQRNAKPKPLMSATIARNHRALMKMLRDARQEGYSVPDNVLEVPGPGEGENDRQAMETVQAVAVMHHATELPHGSRYFVAFYQGLRQGEALGLTWPCVDFAANVLTVEWQLQALPYLDRHDRSKGFRVPHDYVARHLTGRFHLVRPKTSRGYRVIPMVPEIRQALLDLKATQTTPNVGDLVWVRPDGWPINKADDSAEFRELQAAAGVHHPKGRPYTTHEMRNTTATLLLEADVDPVVITAILGHSSWATSAGYTKARTARMQNAMELIAAEIRPKELQ